jgi:hypothetical protein
MRPGETPVGRVAGHRVEDLSRERAVAAALAEPLADPGPARARHRTSAVSSRVIPARAASRSERPLVRLAAPEEGRRRPDPASCHPSAIRDTVMPPSELPVPCHEVSEARYAERSESGAGR